MTPSLLRRLASEAVGSALLLATVIGSGIMAERLSGGNVALTLLGNTLATGAMLIVLVLAFAPISGAHFNPAVSLVCALRRELPMGRFALYSASQMAGAIAGVALAHVMFDQPPFQLSSTVRAGPGQWLGELVATFGLVGTILCTSKSRPASVAYAVGLYIAAAYWFTSSTSFANPAVTAARSLSDTFAGIQATSAPAFIVAEFAGALGACLFFSWLLEPGTESGASAGGQPASASRAETGRRRSNIRRR
jgi:glycerol uptake facilitator-like aquaporin